MTFGQKIEVLTTAKKQTSLKGVSPWVLSKNRTYSYRCFHRNHIRKDRFLVLWKENNDSYGHFLGG